MASNEESKDFGREKTHEEIVKGVIDLKEYAPHILEQAKINRSQSMGATA